MRSCCNLCYLDVRLHYPIQALEAPRSRGRMVRERTAHGIADPGHARGNRYACSQCEQRDLSAEIDHRQAISPQCKPEASDSLSPHCPRSLAIHGLVWDTDMNVYSEALTTPAAGGLIDVSRLPELFAGVVECVGLRCFWVALQCRGL
jgi:hypothetical protein